MMLVGEKQNRCLAQSSPSHLQKSKKKKNKKKKKKNEK